MRGRRQARTVDHRTGRGDDDRRRRLIPEFLLIAPRIQVLKGAGAPHMTFTVSNSLIGWIIIGLLAGWLAGTLSRGHGFGCIANIVIGLIGALLGGWLFTKLGIVGSSSSFLYSLA